jgi:hypothetical protein
MNKSRIFSLLAFFIIFITGCKSNYLITSESKPTLPLNKYTKIHVGWLDLREQDWKVLGYDNIQIWRELIREENVAGLFKYVKEFLPGREYSFASSKSDSDVKNMDLSIKFSVSGIENYKQVPFRPGHVDISAEVHFIDVKTNKEIYTVSFIVYGRNKWSINFEERLNDAVYNLAEFVTEKLQ